MVAVYRQVPVVDAVEEEEEALSCPLRMHEVGQEVGPCLAGWATIVVGAAVELLVPSPWVLYRKLRHTRDTRPHPRISGPCRPDIRTQEPRSPWASGAVINSSLLIYRGYTIPIVDTEKTSLNQIPLNDGMTGGVLAISYALADNPQQRYFTLHTWLIYPCFPI